MWMKYLGASGCSPLFDSSADSDQDLSLDERRRTLSRLMCEYLTQFNSSSVDYHSKMTPEQLVEAQQFAHSLGLRFQAKPIRSCMYPSRGIVAKVRQILASDRPFFAECLGVMAMAYALALADMFGDQVVDDYLHSLCKDGWFSFKTVHFRDAGSSDTAIIELDDLVHREDELSYLYAAFCTTTGEVPSFVIRPLDLRCGYNLLRFDDASQASGISVVGFGHHFQLEELRGLLESPFNENLSLADVIFFINRTDADPPYRYALLEFSSRKEFPQVLARLNVMRANYSTESIQFRQAVCFEADDELGLPAVEVSMLDFNIMLSRCCTSKIGIPSSTIYRAGNALAKLINVHGYHQSARELYLRLVHCESPVPLDNMGYYELKKVPSSVAASDVLDVMYPGFQFSVRFESASKLHIPDVLIGGPSLS